MKRLLLVAVTLMLLLAPAAASWTQAGYDAARTAHPTAEAVSWPDVALQVDLPGELAVGEFESYNVDAPYAPGGPVLHGGDAYVAVTNMPGAGDAATLHDGVVRVDLATGEVERVVELEVNRTIHRITVGDGRLLVVHSDWTAVLFEAHRLTDGERSWTWRGTTVNSYERFGWWCAQPATTTSTIYVSCTGWRYPWYTPFIAALDARTGEEIWSWNASTAVERGQSDAQPGQVLLFGLTSIQGTLYATAARNVVAEAMVYAANFTLYAFDAGTGRISWSVSRDARHAQVEAQGTEEQLASDMVGGTIHPTGSPREVFVRVKDQVISLNPGDGGILWERSVGARDVDSNFTIGSLALDGEALYATSTQTLYRFERANGNNRWETTLDPALGEVFNDAGALALGNDHLYAMTHGLNGEGSTLHAVNPRTGQVDWTYGFPQGPHGEEALHYHSLGPGYIMAAGTDGTLHVIGETEASLGEPPVSTDHYPPVGEGFTIDLSGASPGALGPPTRFKAIWGDGTSTGWQESPVLIHSYTEAGEVTARFIVGNDANQTRSTTATMHVGEAPPPPEDPVATPGPEVGSVTIEWSPPSEIDHAFTYRVLRAEAPNGSLEPVATTSGTSFTDEGLEEGRYRYAVESVSQSGTTSEPGTVVASQAKTAPPTFLQTAFARENQDMTFGVLGILVAVVGAVVGAARRYRKRSRLQTELAAVEQAYEETKHRPSECEAQLAERRTHARGLMLDGVLTEEQFRVVENRIDELLRGLRLEAVEEEFDFLPYSLVKAARGMLEDGEVSGLELDAFLRAVEEDDVLTGQQKAAVRDRIRAWHERDTGGSAP